MLLKALNNSHFYHLIRKNGVNNGEILRSCKHIFKKINYMIFFYGKIWLIQTCLLIIFCLKKFKRQLLLHRLCKCRQFLVINFHSFNIFFCRKHLLTIFEFVVQQGRGKKTGGWRGCCGCRCCQSSDSRRGGGACQPTATRPGK